MTLTKRTWSTLVASFALGIAGLAVAENPSEDAPPVKRNREEQPRPLSRRPADVPTDPNSLPPLNPPVASPKPRLEDTLRKLEERLARLETRLGNLPSLPTPLAAPVPSDPLLAGTAGEGLPSVNPDSGGLRPSAEVPVNPMPAMVPNLPPPTATVPSTYNPPALTPEGSADGSFLYRSFRPAVARAGTTYKQVVGDRTNTIRLDGKRMTIIHETKAAKGQSQIVTIEADYALSPSGVLFGYVTAVDDDANAAGLSMVEDQPFSFRIRMDEQSLTVKNVKCVGLKDASELNAFISPGRYSVPTASPKPTLPSPRNANQPVAPNRVW